MPRRGDGRSGERTAVRAGAVAQRAAQEVRAALRPFTIPNGITLIRLALTPFFVLAILEGNHRLALGIFVAAGISDALDGLLARLLGMRSLLGSYLDPIADKTLLVTAYVALTLPIPGAVRVPLWLTVMALSRDFLIVLVALLLYLGAGSARVSAFGLGEVDDVSPHRDGCRGSGRERHAGAREGAAGVLLHRHGVHGDLRRRLRPACRAHDRGDPR